MNDIRNWILKKRSIWFHIIVGLLTYGIWICIYIFAKYLWKPTNETNSNPTQQKNTYSYEKVAFKAPLYDENFEIEETHNYAENINKILEIEKEYMDLYQGMTNKEIKEDGSEVGEIEFQQTPKIILRHNKLANGEYISVCMYHSEFDKYLTVGKIPQDKVKELLSYFDESLVIKGTWFGGTMKYVDDEYKLKTRKEPIRIGLNIKVYENNSNK